MQMSSAISGSTSRDSHGVHSRMGPLLAAVALAAVAPCSGGAAAPAPACATVDISRGLTTLHEAQLQARRRKTAAGGTNCVIVALGARSFRLTEPLVLTSADANIHWHGEGAEITTGIDVPPDAWTHVRRNGVGAVQLNATPLVNRSHWGRCVLPNLR